MESGTVSAGARVRTSQIVWGVFMGMWLFALTGALVYWGIQAAIRAQII